MSDTGPSLERADAPVDIVQRARCTRVLVDALVQHRLERLLCRVRPDGGYQNDELRMLVVCGCGYALNPAVVLVKTPSTGALAFDISRLMDSCALM